MFKAVEPRTRAARGEGKYVKRPRLIITEGKLLTLNKEALKKIGDVSACDIYHAEEEKLLGIRFKKDGRYKAQSLENVIQIKGNLRDTLPEELRTKKWQFNLDWDKENQMHIVNLGSGKEKPKRRPNGSI